MKNRACFAHFRRSAVTKSGRSCPAAYNRGGGQAPHVRARCVMTSIPDLSDLISLSLLPPWTWRDAAERLRAAQSPKTVLTELLDRRACGQAERATLDRRALAATRRASDRRPHARCPGATRRIRRRSPRSRIRPSCSGCAARRPRSNVPPSRWSVRARRRRTDWPSPSVWAPISRREASSSSAASRAASIRRRIAARSRAAD